MNLLRMAAGALMTVGLIVPASASVAAPPAPLDYVAVGDSYAAGFGAGSEVDGCEQSPLGYPALLDERRQFTLQANATCSGDTVSQVIAKLGSLSTGTDLVTVTVGGNDVQYELVIAACGQGEAACRQAVAAAVARAQGPLSGGLAFLYGSLRLAAPQAEVIVTGYPHLFSPEFGTTLTFPAIDPVTRQPLGFTLALTPTEQQILNDGTDALNAVIRANAELVGFTYVDVVKRFDKHGLGSPQPWIQPFTDAGALHPTAKGYKNGYLHEIRNALN